MSIAKCPRYKFLALASFTETSLAVSQVLRTKTSLSEFQTRLHVYMFCSHFLTGLNVLAYFSITILNFRAASQAYVNLENNFTSRIETNTWETGSQ